MYRNTLLIASAFVFFGCSSTNHKPKIKSNAELLSDAEKIQFSVYEALCEQKAKGIPDKTTRQLYFDTCLAKKGFLYE